MAHYYNKEGILQKKVPLANRKGTREPNLRDAKKNLWYPGVTTVNNIFAKFNLDDWKIKTHLEVVFDNKYLVNNQTLDEFINKTKAKANILMNKPANDGTRIHYVLEQCLKEQHIENITQPEYRLCSIVKSWLHEKGLRPCKTELFLIPEICTYGGTIDLICEDQQGRLVLVDYKTTSFEKKKAIKPYTDHFSQACAYKKGYEQCYGGRIEDIYNLYIDRDTMVKISEYKYSKEEIDLYTEVWELQRRLYKLLKGI